MAKNVKAGEAYVSLFADPKALYAGLKAATAKVRQFLKDTTQQIGDLGRSIRGIGLSGLGAGLATLGVGLKSAFDFASLGDNLSKMSDRLHINTEFLSEMGHVAKMSGSDIGTMESALSSLQSKALSGDDVFHQLGLDTRVLSFQPVEKQFEAVIGQLERIENDAIRAAMATKIFGGAGNALLPMIKQGTAGIAAMRQEARDLGITMTTENAKAAVEMTGAWTRMTQALSGAKTMLGNALAPALTEIFNELAPIIASVGRWIKDNKQLVVTIAKWSAVLAGASGALVLLGTGIVGISTVLGGIGSVLGVFASAATLVGGVLTFLLSPVGLITAGIVALGSHFLKTSDTLAKSVNWMIDSFKELYAFGAETFQGIADAIAAGDLGLAMEVAWNAVKLVWIKGTNWLLDKWYAVKYGLLDVWSSIGYSIATAWEGVTASIATAWQDFTALVKRSWTNTVATLKKVWMPYQNWWQKKMNYMVGKMMGADDAYIESMNKADDARLEQDLRAVENQQNSDLAKIETDRQNRVGQIEAERKAMVDSLAQAQNQDREERAKIYAGDLKNMTDAEDKARADWKAAVEKAAIKRQEFKNKQRATSSDPRKIFDGLTISAPSGGSSRGTFSAFEVGSLGNNVQDKQLNELIKIRQGVENMETRPAVVGPG